MKTTNMEIKDWARNETDLMMKEMIDDVEDKEVYDAHCIAAYKCFYTFLLNTDELERPDLVKAILRRLLDEDPLTPIVDVDEAWEPFMEFETDENQDDKQTTLYRCKRRKSLFKKVEEGEVAYTDCERQVCVNINGKDTYYTSPIAKAVLDKIYPISMPYYPVGKIKIYTEDFKAYPGDYEYDTLGVLYFRLPNGQIKDAKKYFKRDPKTEEIIEIDKQEYYARRDKAEALKKTQENEIFEYRFEKRRTK